MHSRVVVWVCAVVGAELFVHYADVVTAREFVHLAEAVKACCSVCGRDGLASHDDVEGGFVRLCGCSANFEVV